MHLSQDGCIDVMMSGQEHSPPKNSYNISISNQVRQLLLAA